MSLKFPPWFRSTVKTPGQQLRELATYYTPLTVMPERVSAAVMVNGTQVVVTGTPSAVAEAVRTLTGKGE